MKLFSLLLMILSFSIDASAQRGRGQQQQFPDPMNPGLLQPGIPEGSYRGRFRGTDRGRVHLMTQRIQGCSGCFISVIFKNQGRDQEVQAYKSLPQNGAVIDGIYTSTQYTLTPIGVDSDGELTTPNDNPSLVLNITRDAASDRPEFTIASAQSDNHQSFESTMLFKGGDSSFTLDGGESGRYKRPWECQEVGTVHTIISNPRDGSRSATVTWNGSKHELGGIFSLKEKAPGVFTFNGISYLATGTQLQQRPKKIVIFMEKVYREWALLIDPTNPRDVTELRVKL